MDFTGSEAEVEIVNVYYCNWGGEGDKAVCSMEPLDYAYEDKVLHVEIQDGGFYNAKACHITYRIDGEEQEASVAMYRDHFEAKDWKVVFHVRLFQENGDWSAEVIGYGGDEPGREIGNFTNLAEHPIEIGVSTEGFPCEENSRWD